jgi:hypothetical protein
MIAMMAFLHRFRRCKSGAIAIMAAVLMPIMIGFAGLGVEVGHWYLTGRAMQGAADSAAISAATEFVFAGQAGTSYQAVGKDFAKRNGFQDGVNGVTVTICGPSDARTICQTRAGQIKAVIHQNPPLILMPANLGSMHVTKPNVGASAVVSITNTVSTTAGNGCILGLSTTTIAVDVEGNGGITATNCTIASNSVPSSLHLPTGGQSPGVTASGLVLAQSAAFTCTPPKCNVPAGKITLNTTTADPYATTRHFDTPPNTIANITTLTRSGTTATATTAQPHLFLTGDKITIAGASPAGYNVSLATITVTSATTFTYTVAGTLTTPATGTTKTASSCVAFTNGANNPGGTATHPKCYNGGSPNSTTTFNPYTIFNGAMTPNGTKFAGTPSTAGLYVFDGGVTLGSATLGASIYYVRGSAGLTFVSGTLCGITTATATAACPFNSTANGGVTFVMTSSLTNGATGLVSGQHGTVQLTAICTDSASCASRSNQVGTSDTSGLVIFSDTSTTGGVAFSGNSLDLTIEGTFYFPNQTVSISGQAKFEPTACTQVVAKIFSTSGLGTFSNGCLPFGGTGIGGGSTTVTTYRLTQ